jgi:hypothetical protein
MAPVIPRHGWPTGAKQTPHEIDFQPDGFGIQVPRPLNSKVASTLQRGSVAQIDGSVFADELKACSSCFSFGSRR